jgi:hypothetical protein
VGTIPKYKFEHWLLTQSRTILLTLLGVNMIVGGIFASTPPEKIIDPAAPLAVEPPLRLMAESAPAQTEAPPPRVCRLWGPESDPEVFANLRNKLEEDGGVPQVIKSEIEGAPDYLVAVTALNSIENAKRVASELAALDIESYLLHRDDSDPALSVGVFSRKDLADAQRERIENLGYRVELEALVRTQTIYNLWAHVVAETEVYNSSVAPCPTFAQGS